MNNSDPAKAIEQLQMSVSYEFAMTGIAFNAWFGGLYPVYVRATAYLTAKQGTQAAAEFQKILDHPGITLGDPIGALARLQRARALVLSGDAAKAKDAYRDFLNVWKDADSEIPIFQQAKAEYMKLPLKNK